MKELRLPDEDIKTWLLSRKWLNYIGGTGDWQYAHFAYFSADNKDMSRTEDGVYYENEYESNGIWLGRESMGTYATVSVYIKLALQKDRNNYMTEILFYNPRGWKDYESVFKGYVENLEELVTTFRLVGVQESYLTGNQEL
jgi:hypothetical protein